MEFKDSFFEGETRENFYIRPMMKRAWAAQMEILQAIDVICKKHNIMYFAEWGTLLGAIRHQGFIPWDDDIDIGMKREDYESFLYHASLELPKGMELLNAYTNDSYGEVMSQVRNGNKIDFSEKFLQKYHGCPYVVGVDIFPRDYIPRNKNEEEIQLHILTATNVLAQSWNSTEISEEEKQESLKQLLDISGYELNDKQPIQQQLYQLSDCICALFRKEEADEITQTCVLAMNPNYRLPISCYESTIEVPFENIMIPVPVGYEQILTLDYGKDYMIPVNCSGGHNYPFFKEQEERLRELFASAHLPMPACFEE